MTIVSGGGRVTGRALGTHLAAGRTMPDEGALAAELAADRVGSSAPSRGLVSLTIEDQIKELAAGADTRRTAKPLYHVHCDPRFEDPALVATFWRLFELEFGLEAARFASVEHRKGSRGTHTHRVYDVTSAGGKVADLSYDYARRGKVAVLACDALGLPLPPTPHRAAIAKALRADGRPDLAARVEALPRQPRPAVPVSPAERQADARAGSDKVAVADAVMAAWAASDGAPAFAAALAGAGLALATGDKVPVVVDRTGTAFPLARLLGEASHAAGSRIKVAVVRARLQGLALPTLAEARQRQRDAARQAIREEARRAAAEQARLAEIALEAEAERRRVAEAAAVQAAAEAAVVDLAREGRRAVAALAALERERSRPPATLTAVRKRARRARATADVAATIHRTAEAEAAAMVAATPQGWRRAWAWCSGDLGRHDRATAAALGRAESAAHDSTAKGRSAATAEKRRDEKHAGWVCQVVADRDVRQADLAERVDWLRHAIRAVQHTPALATAPKAALREAVRRRRAPPIPIARPGPAHMPRPR